MVGIVRTPRSHEYVGASLFGLFVGNLGVGVGKSKHNGIGSHLAYHLLGEYAWAREPNKDVCPHNGVGKCLEFGTIGGEVGFFFAQPFSIFCDYPFGVYHYDIAALCPKRLVELGAREGGCSSSAYNDASLFDALTGNLEGIEKPCRRDDGRTVLVVVHYGDRQLLFERLLNVEALGGFNVF